MQKYLPKNSEPQAWGPPRQKGAPHRGGPPPPTSKTRRAPPNGKTPGGPVRGPTWGPRLGPHLGAPRPEGPSRGPTSRKAPPLSPPSFWCVFNLNVRSLV
ncbi:hypothetical protein ACSSS7_004477 [Eimeria intestinalis]